MNDLERFYACMNYEPVDRTPFWAWMPWPETIKRWKQEGYNLDEEELTPGDGVYQTYVSLNMGADKTGIYSNWFRPNPPFEKKVIKEDENTIFYISDEGILLREMKNNPLSSMPQFVKFPVDTRKEFRDFWKARMQPDLAQRIGPDWKEQLKSIRSKPYPFIVWADKWGGFFGPLRNLVGVERLCMLFYDDPVFLEEMMDADADFLVAMMAQILGVVKVDAFLFWEDMAYKTAPIVSPGLVRRYMLPRYKKVVEFLVGRGVPFIGLDSDGYMDPLIPLWLDGGINVLFPFEVQAGMDVVKVRKKYGKNLRIWGGVDKRALARGPTAIEAELSRLKPLMDEGGYIPHTDHTVPPDVSYQNYCYYMRELGKLCGNSTVVYECP